MNLAEALALGFGSGPICVASCGPVLLPWLGAEPRGLGGDGQPDCVVSFQVPRDPQAKLRVTVKPLNNLVQPMNEVSKDSFSSLIARVNDTIVVRVPLRRRTVASEGSEE
jgi:hypothetical protein